MSEPCAELSKAVKRRGAVVTWLRHEGIRSDRPFKLLTKSLGLLLFHTKQKGKEGERPEQLKPKFPTSSTLKSPIDP